MAEEQVQTLKGLIDVATQRHHARYGTELERAARGTVSNQPHHNQRNPQRHLQGPPRPARPRSHRLACWRHPRHRLQGRRPARPRAPFAEELPDDIDQLTREERDTVLHLARVFLNHHRRES